MIVVLNTACFYTFISTYFTWFKNKDSQHMAYCNSTISSLLVVCSERFVGYSIACELFSGFLIYDIGHILFNIDLYRKNNAYINYIIHHIACSLICLSELSALYPNIASNLLMLEITVPVGNFIWFTKYHHIDKLYCGMLKFIYFILFSYYRVYKLLYLTIISFYDVKFSGIFFLLFLSTINMYWYIMLIKKNITQYM